MLDELFLSFLLLIKKKLDYKFYNKINEELVIIYFGECYIDLSFY